MKILIADDERMVRIGIISMLEELYPSAHTYLEAKNGRELIALTKEQAPVIAFVDIKMPLMNGLDAIYNAREYSPMTKWIMLTGYPEFEYAKQAIGLGVVDYLLKPASLQTLSDAIEKATESLIDEQEKTLAEFRHDIISLYFHDVPQRLNLEEPNKTCFYAQAMLFSDFPQDEKRTELFVRIDDVLRNGLRTFKDLSARYALFTVQSNELCMVFYGREETANEILGRIKMIKSEFEKSSYPLTGYVAALKKTKSEIYYDYLETIRISSLRCVRGYGQIMRLEDCTNTENLDCLLPFSRDMAAISTAFANKNEIGYKTAVNNLYRNRLNRDAFKLAEQESLLRYLKTSVQVCVSLASYETFVKGLINSADRIYSGPVRCTSSDTIDKILEYVRENYMKDIGVKSIADLLGITPNYLSTLFHESVHQKFTDYISSVRIMQAKKLLAEDPGISVKEVAQRVGYVSVRHFTRVFLRYAGAYPSEFRRHAVGAPAKENRA